MPFWITAEIFCTSSKEALYSTECAVSEQGYSVPLTSVLQKMFFATLFPLDCCKIWHFQRDVQNCAKSTVCNQGHFSTSFNSCRKKENPLGWWLCKYVFAPPKTPLKKNAESCRLHWGVQLEKNMYSAHLLCILSPVQYCIFMTPPPSSQLSFSSFYDLTSQLSAPQATSSPLLKFSPCPDSTGLLSPAAPDAQQILLPSSCHQPSSPSPSSPLQLNCQLPQSFTTFFLLHLTQQPLQVLQPSLLTVQQSSSHSFIYNILCVLMCHSRLFLFQKKDDL